MPVLGMVLIFITVITVVLIFVYERSRRAAHRVELQKAILERMGSVRELAEFLTTDQGERFLASMAPGEFRPQQRVLASIRFGSVQLTTGVFLMFALHTPFFGRPGEASPPLLLGLFLLTGAGVGLLLSAAVSFVIARRLGLIDRSTSAPTKDDAAGPS